MVDEFPQAHALGQGCRKEQPCIDDQAVVVKRRCGYGRDCSVAASTGCSLFLGGFLFQKPLSQMHRSTFLPLQHSATLIFSVD